MTQPQTASHSRQTTTFCQSRTLNKGSTQKCERHDIQISHPSNLTRSHASRNVSDCFPCVFKTTRQIRCGGKCGGGFVAIATGPCNLPNQENQNKLECAAFPVCHHCKSSSWPRTCSSTLFNNRAWENSVCSQVWSTSGWYTVRRVPFTSTSHTLIVRRSKNCFTTIAYRICRVSVWPSSYVITGFVGCEQASQQDKFVCCLFTVTVRKHGATKKQQQQRPDCKSNVNNK